LSPRFPRSSTNQSTLYRLRRVLVSVDDEFLKLQPMCHRIRNLKSRIPRRGLPPRISRDRACLPGFPSMVPCALVLFLNDFASTKRPGGQRSEALSKGCCSVECRCGGRANETAIARLSAPAWETVARQCEKHWSMGRKFALGHRFLHQEHQRNGRQDHHPEEPEDVEVGDHAGLLANHPRKQPERLIASHNR
jgi:hypothetical protein